MMKRRGQIAVAALVLLLVLTPLGSACWAKDRKVAVNKASIAAAVERGVTYVKSKQRKDGSWDGGGYDDGVTALAVHALIKASCPLTDSSVSGGE